MNLYETRADAAQLRQRLAEPGARCPKREAVRLLGIIDRLADALDVARREAASHSPRSSSTKTWS